MSPIRTLILLALAPLAALVLGAADVCPDGSTANERKDRDRNSNSFRGPGGWSSTRYQFPTQLLRDLLAASPAEREKLFIEKADRDRKFYEAFYRNSKSLTDEEKKERVEKRVTDSQQFWAAKVREYEALTPEQREQRLENTQRAAMLRDHLKDLIKLPPSERAGRLEKVPQADLPLVRERLAVWDKLPAEVQGQVREHDSVMHYFTRLEETPAELRAGYLDRYPSSIRRKLEEDIKHWNELPARQREEMQHQFAALFRLTEKEQEKTLTFLPDAERRKMEQALDQFEKLKPEDRRRCMDAYKKYSDMTPEQRQQFMANAERWKNMSEEEKAAWRLLAQKLPPMPPMPPGYKAPSSRSVPAALPKK